MRPEDIGTRLGMLVKALKLKNYEFIKKFGISPNSMARYKNNERYPDPEFLAKLVEDGINVNWLLRGEGFMFINQPYELAPDIRTAKKLQIIDGKPILVNDTDRTYVRTSLFPIVAEISAGDPIEVRSDYEPSDSVEVPIRYIPYGTDSYIAFRVNGASMEPQILHDDIVLIRKQSDWRNTDGKICAVRYEGGITLKRIQDDPQQMRVILQPLNKDFRVLIIDEFQTGGLEMIGPLALQLRVHKI